MPVGSPSINKGEKFYKSSFLAGFRQRDSKVLNYLKVRKNVPQFPPFSSVSSPPIISPLPSDLFANLAAVWHFDSGTTVFTSVIGGHQLNGNTTTSADKFNNAVNINGNLTGSTFVLASGTYTFSMWIKFSGLPATTGDIISNISGFTGYRLQINSSGTLTHSFGASDHIESVSWGSNLTTGIWYHIIFGRDVSTGDEAIIQVNTESTLGTKVAIAGGIMLLNASTFNINPGTATFQLDELEIWDGRFLNTSERTSLWNNGAGRVYQP